MKKSITILFFICFISFSAFSQRHIKGIKAVDLSVGGTLLGKYAELGYAQYLSNKIYIHAGVNFESAKLQKQIPFTSAMFNASVNYKLFSPTESFFVNGTLGIALTSNSISKSSIELKNSSDYSAFNYGAFIGGEAEIFLSDKFVWIINARQVFNAKSDFGSQTFYGGTGIRYNIF